MQLDKQMDNFVTTTGDEEVTIGNGKTLKATKIGKISRMVKQRDGTSTRVTFEAKFVPELWVNLFSLTKPLKTGGKLGNEDIYITISKGDVTIKFDKILKTKTGFVGAVEICPLELENQAQVSLDKGRSLQLSKLHDMLGHVGENTSRLTAKYYSWDVKGQMPRCVKVVDYRRPNKHLCRRNPSNVAKFLANVCFLTSVRLNLEASVDQNFGF